MAEHLLQIGLFEYNKTYGKEAGAFLAAWCSEKTAQERNGLHAARNSRNGSRCK